MLQSRGEILKISYNSGKASSLSAKLSWIETGEAHVFLDRHARHVTGMEGK